MSSDTEGEGPAVHWNAELRERARELQGVLREATASATDLDAALVALERWRVELDSFYQLWLRAEGQASVQCGRGCANCCTQMVFDVHPIEIEALGRWVRRSGMEREVLERLETRLELYARTRRENPPTPGEHEEAWEERVAIAFHAQGQPCVFLADDGACRVHSLRPYACRRYFSLSDPLYCLAEHVGGPMQRGFLFEPDEDADAWLDRLDERAAFDPESRTLDEALGRWLRFRSPTT